MRKGIEIRLNLMSPEWRHQLAWEGDNRDFVVNVVLPLVEADLSARYVRRWRMAYGFDEAEGESLEMWSDGSTAVPNMFFGGLAKDPYGVIHDADFFYAKDSGVPGMALWPNGDVVNLRDSNEDYWQAMRVLEGIEVLPSIRKVGIDMMGWLYWGSSKRRAGPSPQKAWRDRRRINEGRLKNECFSGC